MPFQRPWDSSCPKVWETWEKDGTRFVIQDLPPEDDEEAVKLLVDHLLPDELLFSVNKIKDDPLCVISLKRYWRSVLMYRVSLACYAENDGTRTLVGLNCCIVLRRTFKERTPQIFGVAWNNIHNAMAVVTGNLDLFKALGVDKYYYGSGLVVRKQYRGASLATRILAAREHICRHLGIKATAAMFTGPISQSAARRAGYSPLRSASLRDLVAAGLNYPIDDRTIQFMYKEFK